MSCPGFKQQGLLKGNVCSVSLKPFLQNRLPKSGSLQIENILIAFMAVVHFALISDTSGIQEQYFLVFQSQDITYN